MNTVSPMNPGELPADYRVRLAEERAEADERRRIELLDLSSTANAPETRIRAWERAHGQAQARASPATTAGRRTRSIILLQDLRARQGS